MSERADAVWYRALRVCDVSRALRQQTAALLTRAQLTRLAAGMPGANGWTLEITLAILRQRGLWTEGTRAEARPSARDTTSAWARGVAPPHER
jgi:hypothetical protein